MHGNLAMALVFLSSVCVSLSTNSHEKSKPFYRTLCAVWASRGFVKSFAKRTELQFSELRFELHLPEALDAHFCQKVQLLAVWLLPGYFGQLSPPLIHAVILGHVADQY